jgi:hypothetical protein
MGHRMVVEMAKVAIGDHGRERGAGGRAWRGVAVMSLCVESRHHRLNLSVLQVPHLRESLSSEMSESSWSGGARNDLTSYHLIGLITHARHTWLRRGRQTRWLGCCPISQCPHTIPHCHLVPLTGQRVAMPGGDIGILDLLAATSNLLLL